MTYIQPNANGQATSANSSPVVLSSDQSSIPISRTDIAPSTVNITAQDLVSATATGANSQSLITGTPTAGSAASFTVTGQNTIRVQVTGTWTGTLQAEVSIDGGTTWTIQGIHQTGTAYTVATATANFSGTTNAASITNFRIRSTAAWTGTATVKVIESANNASIYVGNGLMIQDPTISTNRLTVKSASTAALATDPAVVVAISPNNTVSLAAETTKVIGTINLSAAQTLATVTTVSTVTNLSQLGGAAIAMGTGVRSAGTQRVTIATDDSVPVTGTFWQVTQPVSIATAPVLVAGSAIIGKVGIDQTTPGTTNLVALAANQSVNNAQVNGVTMLTGNGVTGTGSQRVTIASDNTAFAVNATLSAETTKVIGTINIAAAQTLATVTTVSTVTNLSQLGGVAISMGTGVRGTGVQRVTIATDDLVPVTGTITAVTAITNALPAGTNLMGKVGIDQTTVGTTNGVTVVPATTGGTTVFHLVSAATTNLTNVKASAGQLYGYYIYNSNAAARKLAFHNTAGTPTAGASIFFTVVIPPTAGANVWFNHGIAFSTGIGISTVTDLTDAGTTAVALNDLNINLFYK